MLPTYYRGCWHVVSRSLFPRYRHYSSLRKEVYNPKAFIPHAALLRQAFAHCAKFPTAASRRSLGRVSVPVWVIVLSDHLPIVALVSRYPTNELIGRRPLPKRLTAFESRLNVTQHAVLATLSGSYSPLRGRSPTRYSAVRHYRSSKPDRPFDLHVSCTPPALILSQDQTLRKDAQPCGCDFVRGFDRSHIRF